MGLFTGGKKVRVEVRALRGEPSNPVFRLGVLAHDASGRNVNPNGCDFRAGTEEVFHRADVDENIHAEGFGCEPEPKIGRGVWRAGVQVVDTVVQNSGDQLGVECNVVGGLNRTTSVSGLEAKRHFGAAVWREGEPLILLVQGEATDVIGEAETTRIEGVVDGLAVLWSDHIGVFCWGFPDFRGTVAWR